jgi:asparagine synthetase B (glutamine-hydrolysing)
VHIYKKYGFDYMMTVVDGVFSLVLFDQRIQYPESKIYVLGDNFGINPLYVISPIKESSNINNNNNRIYKYLSDPIENHDTTFSLRGFSTNYEMLSVWCNELNNTKTPKYMIHKLHTDNYIKFTVSNKVSCAWEVNFTPIKEFKQCKIDYTDSIKDVEKNVRKYLKSAIEKRLDVCGKCDIVCVVEPTSFESVLIACTICHDIRIRNPCFSIVST